MFIIGCDFHSRFQQIAMLDPTTGEVLERRLEHENEEAKKFYASLPGPARVGMEATFNAQWFERMLQEHSHELWIGDAAEIRAAMVRQMLRHRHKLVRFRTSVKNQLHALAMTQGLCRRKKLWGRVGRKELESLVLDPWASRRREDLLKLLDQLDPWIDSLDEAVIQAANGSPQAVCLMEQAGVGPVTALAFVLTIGPVSRFANSKKVVSYLGLNPSEDSSAGRQRLGAISKQGNSMMRYLLTEAAQGASRLDPEIRRDYQRLKFRRGSAVAKVAIARKLTVRLYWKLRAAQPVPSARMQGSPGTPVVGESLSPN